MNTLPIIQTFFDKPVRFFKMEIMPELRHRYDDAGTHKYLLETWGIPLNDFADAVGYPRQLIWRLIRNNIESFRDYFKTETILDRGGVQNRSAILMAVEICEALTMRLQASRIKDETARQRVINFQRWVPIAFHLIRTGKLRGVRWNLGKDIPSEILALLSVASGRETNNAVKAYSEKEGISVTQGYRRLQQVRGCNSITTKGVPKKSPSFKGTTKHPEERQKALAYKNEHPKAGGKEIKEKLGLTVSSNTVNTWIRLRVA